VEADDVREPADRPHAGAGDELRLVLIGVRHHHVRPARLDRGEHRRQDAADRAHATVET
jgi:hypothetical protein